MLYSFSAIDQKVVRCGQDVSVSKRCWLLFVPMLLKMTVSTERDQIVERIVAKLAPESLVMDL